MLQFSKKKKKKVSIRKKLYNDSTHHIFLTITATGKLNLLSSYIFVSIHQMLSVFFFLIQKCQKQSRFTGPADEEEGAC